MTCDWFGSKTEHLITVNDGCPSYPFAFPFTYRQKIP